MYPKKRLHKGPTAIMRECLPCFCWQTTLEILRMLEQYDIDAPLSYESVKVEISRFVRDGKILRRRIPNPSIPPVIASAEATQKSAVYEYRRNPKWSRKCPKKH